MMRAQRRFGEDAFSVVTEAGVHCGERGTLDSSNVHNLCIIRKPRHFRAEIVAV